MTPKQLDFEVIEDSAGRAVGVDPSGGAEREKLPGDRHEHRKCVDDGPDVLKLTLLVRTPLFERTEVLLDDPSRAVSLDDLFDLLCRLDRFRGRQLPVDCVAALWRLRLAYSHDVHAQCRRSGYADPRRPRDLDGASDAFNGGPSRFPGWLLLVRMRHLFPTRDRYFEAQ